MKNRLKKLPPSRKATAFDPARVRSRNRRRGSSGASAAGRYAIVAGAALFVLCVYLEPMRDELQFGQIDIVLLACAWPIAWPNGPGGRAAP
jgi:hypothetical protein